MRQWYVTFVVGLAACGGEPGEPDATYDTLEAFRDATGIERSSIADDPLFVDPARGEFELRPGSPAIDSGEDQGEGGACGGATDMGAHESC